MVKFADLSLDSVDQKSVDMTAEWGQGAVLYATAVTPLDLKALTKRHPSIMTSPTPEAVVDLLIRKATNAEGEKFFTLEDKPKLMLRPVREIEKAAECLGEIDISDEKIEGEEKN